MPSFSPQFEEEFLGFLGWTRGGDLWSHAEYQPQPGSKPELHSHSSFWWMLEWIIHRRGAVTYMANRGTIKDGHKSRYLRVTQKLDKVRSWVVRDYDRKNPQIAILSVLLKMKRFPDGLPTDREQIAILAGLSETPELRQLAIPKDTELRNIKPRLRKLQKMTDALEKSPPKENDETSSS